MVKSALDLPGRMWQLVQRGRPDEPVADGRQRVGQGAGNPAGKLSERASSRPRESKPFRIHALPQELQNTIIQLMDPVSLYRYLWANKKAHTDVRTLAPFKLAEQMIKDLRAYLGAKRTSPVGTARTRIITLNGEDEELNTFAYALHAMSDSLLRKLCEQYLRYLQEGIYVHHDLQTTGRAAGAMLGSGRLQPEVSRALASAVRNTLFSENRHWYRSQMTAYAFSEAAQGHRPEAVQYLVDATRAARMRNGEALAMPRQTIDAARLPEPVLKEIEDDVTDH